MQLNIKLRKLLDLSVLGFTLLGLSAPAASVFNYTDGDLILDFSESGYPDVEVNIGNISNLVSAATTAGGTVQITNYNVNSQLLGIFESVTPADAVNNLSFTVFGLQNNASNGVAAKTIFLTQQQTGATTNAAPNDVTASKQTGLIGTVQKIIGLGQSVGLLNWSSSNPANSTNNASKVVIIPTSGVAAVNSYTVTGSGDWGSYVSSSPSIANTTSSSFSTDGGSVISDLFEYDYYASGGTSHKAVFKGYFTFKSDGTLSFSVPGAQVSPSTVITAITVTNRTVTVSFNTTTGVKYSLYYTTNLNLARSSWTSNAIAPYTGTGSTGTLTDTTATNKARFYNVRSYY